MRPHTILFLDVLRVQSIPPRDSEVYSSCSTSSGARYGWPFAQAAIKLRSIRIKPPVGKKVDPNHLRSSSSTRAPATVLASAGFKAQSGIGIPSRPATDLLHRLRAEPIPGQTIEDIAKAEAQFLEKVIEIHPEADGKPFVIGNCQAGWAVMLVAAERPELFGPILLAGSPLSYWAGVHGRTRCATQVACLEELVDCAHSDLGRGSSTALTSSPTSKTSIPPIRSGPSNPMSGPRSTRRRRATSA